MTAEMMQINIMRQRIRTKEVWTPMVSFFTDLRAVYSVTLCIHECICVNKNASVPLGADAPWDLSSCPEVFLKSDKPLSRSGRAFPRSGIFSDISSGRSGRAFPRLRIFWKSDKPLGRSGRAFPRPGIFSVVVVVVVVANPCITEFLRS